MLKTVIQNSGDSQRAWAARLEISQSYLSLLLKGEKVPSLELAVRIERATGGRVPAISWVPDERDVSAASRGAA